VVCGIFAVALLYLLSTQPVEYLLIHRLEDMYKPVSMTNLQRLNCIVVLSGGIQMGSDFQKQPEAMGATYSRIFNAVMAFKKSSAETLIISGGGFKNKLTYPEAEVMRDIALKLGVPADKIKVEKVSTTTQEQALELSRNGFIPAKTTLGLVTSAIHMPRAMALFLRAFRDNEIIAIPCGYIYPHYVFALEDLIPTEANLYYSALAVHEWCGLISIKQKGVKQKGVRHN